MRDTEITVEGLCIYPVKGCGGIQLQSAAVTPLGLATPNKLLRDRFWMVVREDGKFVTQRQNPELALVRLKVQPHEAIMTQPVADPPTLILSAPNMPDLNIQLFRPYALGSNLNLNPNSNNPTTTARHCCVEASQVEVWGWRGLAYSEHDAASDWFSEFLRMPVRMVRYGGDVQHAAAVSHDNFHRQADRNWAPDGVEIAFADAYPILLTSLESLKELNRHLPSPIPMNRFRPNITITTAVKGGKAGRPLAAWDEDYWERLSIGPTGEFSNEAACFINVKPCDRCKVPTIDQETGVAGEEPLATLRKLRSGRVLGWVDPPSFKLSVFFGVNLCCIHCPENHILKVGDTVTIDAYRDGPYLQRKSSHA